MIKRGLRKIAGILPLRFYTAIFRRDVLGLNYHIVSRHPRAHIRFLYAYKSPQIFERDLVYLKKHFQPVGYEQLIAYRAGKQKSPKNAIILTFDDGLSECYSVIRPLLLKHQIPAIFFVSTGYVDNRDMSPDFKASLCMSRLSNLEHDAARKLLISINQGFEKDFTRLEEIQAWIRSIEQHDTAGLERLCHLFGIDIRRYLEEERPYLTTAEIKTLAVDGFTIGSHAVEHIPFSRLSATEIEANILASCAVIGALTGEAQVPFAFPYSTENISRELLADIRARNPEIGLFFGGDGISRDREFLISRMTGDSPRNISGSRTNLPYLMKRAYIEALAAIAHRAGK